MSGFNLDRYFEVVTSNAVLDFLANITDENRYNYLLDLLRRVQTRIERIDSICYEFQLCHYYQIFLVPDEGYNLFEMDCLLTALRELHELYCEILRITGNDTEANKIPFYDNTYDGTDIVIEDYVKFYRDTKKAEKYIKKEEHMFLEDLGIIDFTGKIIDADEDIVPEQIVSQDAKISAPTVEPVVKPKGKNNEKNRKQRQQRREKKLREKQATEDNVEKINPSIRNSAKVTANNSKIINKTKNTTVNISNNINISVSSNVNKELSGTNLADTVLKNLGLAYMSKK